MAKTNWNTGDIITEDKVNLIETKVEALLNTVNSLVGVVRGLEKYISEVETSQVKGLEELDENNVIGYTSPADMEIPKVSEALETLIDNAITGRINTTWPDATQTLENADNDIVGIEGSGDAASVGSLKAYIDKCMNESYETLKGNIQTATEDYYSKYVLGDILITTISREKEGEEKGNTLSNENTGPYWVPFGQGRMLIGAGNDVSDGTNIRSFKLGDTGGEYKHKLTEKEIPPHSHQLTNFSSGSGQESAYITTKNRKRVNKTTTKTGGGQSHENMPPYIVVYFYKCCDEEEYNTYYSIIEETETDSSSEGTENNTPSEGTSTDSENP